MPPHIPADSAVESELSSEGRQSSGKGKQEILIDGKWVDVTSFMAK